MPDHSAPRERSIDGLYRAALGEASAERYLPVFARFDAQGAAGPAWNSAAAALNLGWLIHHRLWYPLAVCSALFVALALLVAGLWQLAPGWPMGVKLGGSLALLLCVLMVPGLWGSAWLHDRLRQRVVGAVERAPTIEAACDALRAEAGARQRRNTWVLAAGLSLGVLAGLLWKTVPWSNLLGSASPSLASSPLALPAPLAPTPLGSHVPVADAVALASPGIEEPKNLEVGADGLSIATEARDAVPVDDQSAKPDSAKGTQPEARQTPSEGKPGAEPTVPVKPVAQAGRAASPSIENATRPSAAPVKSKAKPAKAPDTEANRSTGVGVEAKAKSATPAAASSGLVDTRTRVKGFGVAVGMFAVASNADRVIETLADAGLPVISDSVASARGELTRVRVGPFELETQAAAAAAKVTALGLDAKVYAP